MDSWIWLVVGGIVAALIAVIVFLLWLVKKATQPPF